MINTEFKLGKSSDMVEIPFTSEEIKEMILSISYAKIMGLSPEKQNMHNDLEKRFSMYLTTRLNKD